MMNNNEMIVDHAEEAIDDDDMFNTNFVDASLATADFFSKSLNDLHSDIIPQNGLRPNLVAFKSDDYFFTVSISNRYSTVAALM